MKTYIEKLRENDLKVTPQRVAIINELFTHGHLGVEDIYKALLDKFGSLSLATVYKNINAMGEKMLVKEIKLPKQKSVYELSKTEHAHMLCEKCGKVKDIELDLETVFSEALKKSNFKTRKSDLVLIGICSFCHPK